MAIQNDLLKNKEEPIKAKTNKVLP